jgi:amidase/aspartyl-tRNA(Asn)/glutamyl-tRNA(Gln) amidotransferase subunit A
LLALRWWALAGAVCAYPSPAAAQSIDVVEITVDQIHAAYTDGKYTAADLTRAFLDRIEQYASFDSVEEWEALSGQEFRQGRGQGGQGGRGSAPLAQPSATEAGDAFQAWRMRMRELYRGVLEKHVLDGLFFPQAGASNRDLIEDPESPDYKPNNWPELPSNIINDFGVPVVTVPYSYYGDRTPFVLAFIGDLWTEAELLVYAYVLEHATKARVPPRLSVTPRG